MKRFFNIAKMCLLIFALSSCTTNTTVSNSPDEVAINYLNGLAQQNFDEMDKYSIVEYEKIHKPIIENAMRAYSKTEAELYAMLLEIEAEEKAPENYEEYRISYVEKFKKDLQKEYGENYSINTTIITQTDIDTSQKSQVLQEASDYYDRYNVIISDIVNFAEIDEIKKVQCKVYISGTKETTENFSICIVKIGSEWKVLNIGIA